MSRRNRNEKHGELVQMMDVKDIRFDRIYVNAIPMSEDISIYGYVREWRNGEVGYSVKEEAEMDPDLSNCSVFWMKPEDFAKAFVVYCDMPSEAGGEASGMESMSEFRELIKGRVMDAVPQDMKEGLTIHDTDVVKINDQKLYGLSFRKAVTDPAPTFYLNDLYENYLHGMPVGKIVKQLVDSYMFSIHGLSAEIRDSIQTDNRLDLKDMKDRIVFRVLEKSRNEEFLKTVPHKDIGHGFAVVFDVQNVIGGNDVWRMPITHSFMKEAGMTEDDLMDIARNNVNEVDPAVLMSLERHQSGKKLKNLFENDKAVSKEKTAYVLTNRCGKYGASVLFYPGVQERVADRIDDGYYAIPSSLHEFMIFPAGARPDMESIRDKLKNDNVTTTSKEDVFSDKMFYYDRGSGQLVYINEMLDEDKAAYSSM